MGLCIDLCKCLVLGTPIPSEQTPLPVAYNPRTMTLFHGIGILPESVAMTDVGKL